MRRSAISAVFALVVVIAGCTEDFADSCQAGVEDAVDEIVVRPVFIVQCTYSGEDVVVDGEVILRQSTTIRGDWYATRPVIVDGELRGLRVDDQITGESVVVSVFEGWICDASVAV